MSVDQYKYHRSDIESRQMSYIMNHMTFQISVTGTVYFFLIFHSLCFLSLLISIGLFLYRKNRLYK